MTYTMVFALALTTGAQPAAERAELDAAVATMRRLAESATKVQPGDTAEVAAKRVRLAELVRAVDDVVRIDRPTGSTFNSTQFFNLVQMTRDVVVAGADLAVLPEEALCWQRVGLNFAAAHHRVVHRKVYAGLDPPQCENQSRVQVEQFRVQYQSALARCTPDRR